VKYLVPLCLFAIVAGLFFGLGGLGSAQPNLQVAAGELNYWEDWSISPCKYTYGYWENSARVSTTISNLSGEDCSFALGDGSIFTIPANGNLTQSYKMSLKGQTERVRIVKLAGSQGGLSVQEALVLKIEPRTKGGDTR
jgi:hypothetical protein